MSEKNAKVEKRLAEANKVLEQCRQRQIDPVKALQRAVRSHDKRDRK